MRTEVNGQNTLCFSDLYTSETQKRIKVYFLLIQKPKILHKDLNSYVSHVLNSRVIRTFFFTCFDHDKVRNGTNL